MGLDQYAFVKMKQTKQEQLRDYLTGKVNDLVRITYWRKHNALHGWMADLYESRGNENEFNCELLQLFEEDILKLKEDIAKGNLKERSGFFFGSTDYMSDYLNTSYYETDCQFIEEALMHLKDGDEVFYSAYY